MSIPLSPITETEFLNQILQLAKLHHWRAAHFRPAMTKHGWRTPVQADGKGFPDLVLLKATKLIAAEIKLEHGKLTDAQLQWLLDFAKAGAATYCWRPSDWTEITKVLGAP